MLSSFGSVLITWVNISRADVLRNNYLNKISNNVIVIGPEGKCPRS